MTGIALILLAVSNVGLVLIAINFRQRIERLERKQ